MTALLHPVLGKGQRQLGQRQPVGLLAIEQRGDDVRGQGRQFQGAGHISHHDTRRLHPGWPTDHRLPAAGYGPALARRRRQHLARALQFRVPRVVHTRRGHQVVSGRACDATQLAGPIFAAPCIRHPGRPPARRVARNAAAPPSPDRPSRAVGPERISTPRRMTEPCRHARRERTPVSRSCRSSRTCGATGRGRGPGAATVPRWASYGTNSEIAAPSGPVDRSVDKEIQTVKRSNICR